LRILFTKSQNSSENLIKQLLAKGHEVIIFPILNIKPLLQNKIDFKDFNSVIFTSANAIYNLESRENIEHLNCFCVGEQTAAVAKKFGFLNIQITGNNYDQLKKYIFKSVDKSKDKFIYVRGEYISNDLEGDFKKEGIFIKAFINYTTELNTQIDPKLIADLKEKLIDVIFIYSKRAAGHLLKIILNNKIQDDLVNCNLNCISINVANTLKKIKWKKIKIFSIGAEELSLN